MTSLPGTPSPKPDSADSQASITPPVLCPQCPLRGQDPGSPASSDPEATECSVPPADPFATGWPASDVDPYPTIIPNSELQSPAPGVARPAIWSFGEDYEIIERIAQGGMGSIYKARQIAANRLVALKMIQPGHLATTDQVERFRREARAAAELAHPGIITIHDVGEVNSQHYFSMEWLDGGSLKDLLTEGPLHPRMAAEIIRQAADALEYAHQRGMIHRDIKPHNIMLERRPMKGALSGSAAAAGSSASFGSSSGVGEVAGAPRVKLIDFGLVRFMEGSDQTRSGVALGTPSYMPPEQARGDSREIGPWSDVYGLGAVLYQLLSGRPPFQSASEHETLRQVREEEPVPPRRVNAAVPVDLEKVCLKCLRKDRSKRYATAGALAEELSRFLRGEPVHARPIGAGERAWKWCRRNRALAGVLGVLVVVVLSSLTSLTVLYLRAEHHRRTAEREKQIAERRERETLAITRFYEEHVLAAARPKGQAGGSGKDMTLKEALDAAGPTIEKTFREQPELEATVRNTLGMTYWYLGKFDAANPHLERAHAIRLEVLGPDDPATLTSLHNLALQRWKQGKLAESAQRLRTAAAKRKQVLGDQHRDTLWAQLNLGLLLSELDQLDEAEQVLRRAIQTCREVFGPEDIQTLYGQNDLSLVLWARGKEAESVELDRRTLEGRRRSLGSTHPDTLRSMGNLAVGLMDTGRLEEAEPLCIESLEGRRKELGPDHIETLWGEQYLGKLLALKQEFEHAEAVLRNNHKKSLTSLGPDNPTTARALHYLGEALCLAGKPAEAEPFLKDCLTLREKILSRGHWHTAFTRGLLGHCLALQGRRAAAEPHLLAANERLAKGAPVRRVTDVLDWTIELYEKANDPKQADIWRMKRRETRK